MLENYRDLFILNYVYQYSASASPVRRGVQQGPMPPRGELPAHRVPLRRPGLGPGGVVIFAKFCKFLAGLFSAVSKRNFARKYAFDIIFQALQDVHTFAPLQTRHFSKKIKIGNFEK